MTQFAITRGMINGIRSGILPDPLKQSSIVLRFEEPIPATLIQVFYTIKLSEFALGAGEESMWLPQFWQPSFIVRETCPFCGQFMSQKAEVLWRCENRRCDRFGLSKQSGPVRGVVSVITFADSVVEIETVEFGDGTSIEIECVDTVLIALDRRYEDGVLRGVRELAANLCEEKGWKLRCD